MSHEINIIHDEAKPPLATQSVRNHMTRTAWMRQRAEFWPGSKAIVLPKMHFRKRNETGREMRTSLLNLYSRVDLRRS